MIKIDRISKCFDGKAVLRDFSAEIKEGSVTCIMGESGCGKSTLLSVMMGLIKADSGTVTGVSDKKISVVFQENRLLGWLSAVGNAELVQNGEATASPAEMLASLGFDEQDMTKRSSALSGGMKRRAAIVRALSVPFDILFADEPFKELDDETKRKTISLISEKAAGKTVIIVTHDLDDAMALGAEIIEMKKS